MPSPVRKTPRPTHPPLPEGSAELVEGKLFMTGRSQALRLPAAFRFPGDTVYLKKTRGVVLVIPKDDPWRSLIESAGNFPDDFMADWTPPPETPRPELDQFFE